MLMNKLNLNGYMDVGVVILFLAFAMLSDQQQGVFLASVN